MKTKILPAVICLCGLAAISPPAGAQSAADRQGAMSPVYGVQLGMELTFPTGGTSYYKQGAGVVVGPSVTLPLSEKFYFEPALLLKYSSMSSKYLISFDEDYSYRGAVNIYTLRVPLEFGYRFNIADNTTMSVATGPWINFNLSARQSITPNFAAPDPEPDRKINLIKHGWKRVDALWGIKLKFTFSEHYYVGVTTGVAFTPLASFGNRDKKIRIYGNTVAISLGYNF